MCCIRSANVDWQCDSGFLCYGDLLRGRLFHVELYETIVFIHLFNSADFKLQIIYRRMRNGIVIIVSKLVNNVIKFIVANADYGISMQVQRKTKRNLIQDRDINRNQLDLNQERFLHRDIRCGWAWLCTVNSRKRSCPISNQYSYLKRTTTILKCDFVQHSQLNTRRQ
jgi:hypothetical protein